MNIDDRFVGDTNPLVMWLYNVNTNGTETPVELININATVLFKFKKGLGIAVSITGVNMTNLGYVEFPFLSNTAEEGDYVYTVRVINGISNESMVYAKGKMNIQGDI